MAATADPRAKPPAAPTAHHLEPWARQPRAHRVREPAHPVVEESPSVGASAGRDRHRSSSHPHRKGAPVVDDEGGGIEGLRAKLMGHLRDAADRLRVPHSSGPPLAPPAPPPQDLSPPPERKEPSPDPTAPPPSAPAQQQEVDLADKPWKLRERTRRRPASLTSWPAAPRASSSSSRRRKRAPFSLSLAPEEIEEDIYALTGGRPRRRPRKRPRAVQRQLDSVFPGLWLTEITADDYKVPDE